MRIDRGPRQPLAPGSRAAPQIWIHCLQPSWNSGARIGSTAHACGRHGLLALLATRVLSGFIPPSTLTGPGAKGGGRWLGRRRGTVRVWSPPDSRAPFPLNSPSAAPQPPTPFLSFLYISSELAVAVQSLVNDALLLLTTLQFPGLHSLHRCLDLGDTPQLTPALGLFTCCCCPRASTINTRTRPRTYIANKQTLYQTCSPCCPRLLPWPSPPPSSRPRLTLSAILPRRVRCGDAPFSPRVNPD